MKEKHMIDGKWYRIEPPSVINKEIFTLVQCEYQNPGNPIEYSVRGIPEGGEKEKPFILKFSGKGKVRVIPTEPSTPPPILRRVK